jgi:hypothetical protein
MQKTGGIVAEVDVIGVANDIASNAGFRVASILESLRGVPVWVAERAEVNSYFLDVAFGVGHVHAHGHEVGSNNSFVASVNVDCSHKRMEEGWLEIISADDMHLVVSVLVKSLGPSRCLRKC